MKTLTVKLTPSYELKNDLWVEVDGVYHICLVKDNHLCTDTLCGIKDIGYGREWGYRLVSGTVVCSECAKNGNYTNNDDCNMQNFELVLKKKN